jgi:murein L,D-transpeptidase YafK
MGGCRLLTFVVAFFITHIGYGSVSRAGEITASVSNKEVERITNDMVVLWVSKSELKAHLMTWPEDLKKSEVLMSFKIAIGKEEGDKQTEGDNRTPEGIYISQTLMEGKSLPVKYGPMAIPINFPNPIDRINGKTGHGIWLHGVEQDQRVEAAKVTEGCVAFYNADIVTLAKWLRPQQAVVMIGKGFSGINEPTDIEKLKEATQGWSDAWEHRDVKKYISFYDEEFKHPIGGRKAYEDYKRKVFAGYKKMTAGIKDIRVFAHETYGVAIMNQNFKGDNRFVANGRKILYWSKQKDGSWHILHEAFDANPLQFISFTGKQVADSLKGSPSLKIMMDTKLQTPHRY